jgi:hypothetical protein
LLNSASLNGGFGHMGSISWSQSSAERKWRDTVSGGAAV